MKYSSSDATFAPPRPAFSTASSWLRSTDRGATATGAPVAPSRTSHWTSAVFSRHEHARSVARSGARWKSP